MSHARWTGAAGLFALGLAIGMTATRASGQAPSLRARGAIEALVADAGASPPEFAADLFIRFAGSPASAAKLKHELVESAFNRASSTFCHRARSSRGRRDRSSNSCGRATTIAIGASSGSRTYGACSTSAVLGFSAHSSNRTSRCSRCTPAPDGSCHRTFGSGPAHQSPVASPRSPVASREFISRQCDVSDA